MHPLMKVAENLNTFDAAQIEMRIPEDIWNRLDL